MKKFLVGSATFLLPVLAFAQGVTTPPITSLSTLLARIQQVINVIIPFLIGLAVFIIIYGIFGFISSAGDEEARAGAKGFIIWGIIGVFLMLSVWGLIGVLVNTFGIGTSQTPTAITTSPGASIPQLNPQPGNI